MKILLILAVGLLSFANGANDNFKGVAPLWGAGLTTYSRAIASARGIVLPLLFSGIIALLLTVGFQLLVARTRRNGRGGDCVCIDEPKSLAMASVNSPMSHIAIAPSTVRWAPAAECETDTELVRLRISDGVHWFSSAAISFARGLNDTPKLVAVLLVAVLTSAELNYVYVAIAIAMGGGLGASRVGRTMSKEITPMAASEAVSANLVAAALVILASPFGLPVSTTHVTSGGIFGIGLLREHEADSSKVRAILLAWAVTLP